MSKSVLQLLKTRSETVFDDYKCPYDDAQATTEANRCLFCTDAPCITACPTSIDIPQFIRKIGTGNIRGAAKTIFSANILGTSCARVCPVEVLCVGACVHNDAGTPPIQIGKLQRHATDVALAKGWRFFEAGADTGKHVALVGAGPASLACAHELRRLGHRCTIFDKRALPGGLNTTGVAPYKMKVDRSLEEVAWILGIGGIEVRTGVAIGTDVTFDQLESEFDAVFIGVGLGPDSQLRIPGEGLPGVLGAVAAIEQLKLTQLELDGAASAVVIGGGNTAIDAVRELRGLGIADVTLIYRGVEAKMSGYAHEWAAAKVEGVHALWQLQPIAFEGTERVERVRCVKLDVKKQPIAGSEVLVPADLVLMACGQSKLEELVRPIAGLQLELGRIVVDERQATTRAGVFAGGDCANGGKEVVNAAAEGKAAAGFIDAYLMGGK